MTNSFWRETLDYIPGLFLIFRVDEKEDAHLMFANSHIRDVLGYKPEEFVLASESQGSRVQAEVAELVEKIAEQSRSGDPGTRAVCRFHSKRAEARDFHFSFRIFTAKSAPHPFIAVSLEPVAEGKGDAGTETSVTGQRNVGFVAESSLMLALMRKVDSLADQQVHLLFRGERATGKRTLARQVLQAGGMQGFLTMEWNLERLPVAEQNRVVDALCGKNGTEQAVSPDQALVLLVTEVSMLTAANQEKLLDWLRDRQQAGAETRILATTSFLLEERMQQGDFSADLYYFLSFDTLLLPPLSQRRDDLRMLCTRWVKAAAAVLELGDVRIPDSEIDRVLEYGWPGNFHEFHEVMRRSLLGSAGSFRLILESPADGERIPEGGSAEQAVEASASGHGADNGAVHGADLLSGDVLPFDEMNRRYLEKVLQKTGNKIYGEDGAARLLGMKPTTLQSKLKKLGVR